MAPQLQSPRPFVFRLGPLGTRQAFLSTSFTGTGRTQVLTGLEHHGNEEARLLVEERRGREAAREAAGGRSLAGYPEGEALLAGLVPRRRPRTSKISLAILIWKLRPIVFKGVTPK